MRNSLARKIKRAVVVGGLLIGVAALALAFLVRASLPILDGRLELPGLKRPVMVERDELGVPTIRADDREDLALATGFLHGQDRFFQMDLMRRNAAGELAALIGRPALELDRANRLHGFARLALKVVEAATVEERRLLDAYTAGVNLGLTSLGARPFEYLVLRSRPEIWKPEDSILVTFAMYMRLNDHTAARDMSRSTLKDVLPGELYHFLEPKGSEWDAPLVGDAILPATIPSREIYDLHRLDPVVFRFPLKRYDDAPDAPGSNSWVLSGARTASGSALLANDMHLGLGIPNTWYRARLVVAGDRPVDISGVTLPGSFPVVAGSNGSIAWGFTNSYGDWVDLVALEIDPERPDRYLTPNGYLDFVEREEVLDVKGGSSVALRIRETIWGPVFDTDHRGRPVALQWLAHRAGASNLKLYELERAEDVHTALDIANRTGIPPQNFLVADAKGNIAWTIMGRLPDRRGYDSSVASVLSLPQQGWVGWLPPSRYPRVVNPASGQLWTANARVVDESALGLIGEYDYPLGARAAQIRDALTGLPAATPLDMLALQLDDTARFLEGWRGLLLHLLDSQRTQQHPARLTFREAIADWGGRAAVDSVGYRLVREFRDTVIDRVFAALTAEVSTRYPDAQLRPSAQFEGVVQSLIAAEPSHLLHPDFGSWPEFMLAIVDQLIDDLMLEDDGLLARTWGERNTVQISHPLSRALPALAPWLDMPAEALPGDIHMPRVQGPRFGASERFAVAPGFEEEGYFHMPGGQSGHPWSPYYRSGHESWMRGTPTSFLPGAAEHRLELSPP